MGLRSPCSPTVRILPYQYIHEKCPLRFIYSNTRVSFVLKGHRGSLLFASAWRWNSPQPRAALCCAVEPCSAPTAAAHLTTNWDLSRDVVSTETSASMTPEWPSHPPTVWSVWRSRRGKLQTVASCPVHSHTDVCGYRAFNDIFGSQPVSAVHVCDDGGSSRFLLNLQAVSLWKQAQSRVCLHNTPACHSESRGLFLRRPLWQRLLSFCHFLCTLSGPLPFCSSAGCLQRAAGLSHAPQLSWKHN